MNTFVFPIEQSTTLAMARQQLANNHAIVAPTDTVYGLMCRFDQPQAIDQLYAIKGRPPEKAIPVLIGDPDQLSQVTQMPIPPIVQVLLEHFWPGPLTIVLPALPTLPAILTAHQPTVGIRLPDHAWLRALIRASGPLAATSANLSGQREAHTTAEVLAQLQGRVGLIASDTNLEQKEQTQAIASTVLAIDTGQNDTEQSNIGPRVHVLRPGPILAPIQDLLQKRFGILC